MAAYTPSEWHDFFLGTLGASAALTGLLFVAISINLQQILKHSQLPGRAAGTLGILVCALVVSGFGLAPGQGNRALGLEVVVAGAAVVAQTVWATRRKQDKEVEAADERSSLPRVEHLVSMLLPSLAFVAGGLSLIARGGGGLYWVLSAILLAFVVASLDAWVLLVEIHR